MSGWTDERKELAIKLWRDGWSGTQIARRLNCDLTRNAVIGFLHRLKVRQGSTLRPRPGGSIPLVGDRLARVKALFADGFNGAEIAEQLGDTSKSAVNHVLRASGLARQDREPSALEVIKISKPKAKRAPKLAIAGNGAVFEKAPAPPPRIPESYNIDAWAALPGSAPVNLLGLDYGMCKWPVEVAGATEIMFCGCKTDGSRWCLVHTEAEAHRARKQHAWPITLSEKQVERMARRAA